MENKGGKAGKEENVSGHPQQNMSKTCGVELFKEMGLRRCPKKAVCTAKQSAIDRGGDSPMKIQGSCTVCGCRAPNNGNVWESRKISS